MSILRIIHTLILVMEVTSELSDLVVMQSKHTKFFNSIKMLVSGLSVSKTLI